MKMLPSSAAVSACLLGAGGGGSLRLASALALGEVIADIAVAIPGLVLAFGQARGPRKSLSLFDAGDPKS